MHLGSSSVVVSSVERPFSIFLSVYASLVSFMHKFLEANKALELLVFGFLEWDKDLECDTYCASACMSVFAICLTQTWN